jgi:hypothetical protein
MDAELFLNEDLSTYMWKAWHKPAPARAWHVDYLAKNVRI